MEGIQVCSDNYDNILLIDDFNAEILKPALHRSVNFIK